MEQHQNDEESWLASLCHVFGGTGLCVIGVGACELHQLMSLSMDTVGTCINRTIAFHALRFDASLFN